MLLFQSTLLRKERPNCAPWVITPIFVFQSTLLRKERRGGNCMATPNGICFNPRSYERSDFFRFFNACRKKACFNPRSYERSDIRSAYSARLDGVSIHAPTKGATRYPGLQIKLRVVSIHAPTKGATEYDAFNASAMAVSIHAPTKGATFTISFLIFSLAVSIHAPTKGATKVFFHKWCCYPGFNPRSYERSDSNFTQIII